MTYAEQVLCAIKRIASELARLNDNIEKLMKDDPDEQKEAIGPMDVVRDMFGTLLGDD